jgi:hypothetical protein
VLYTIAGALVSQVAPQVATPFGQQTAGLSAMMATILAQEFDRAASRLVDENAAIVATFASAATMALPGALAEKLAAAVDAPPAADFRVSALQARNDSLRGLLVELHVAVETIDSTEARVIDARIWDELRESTRRRHLAGVGG